jgi:hypothetical protein
MLDEGHMKTAFNLFLLATVSALSFAPSAGGATELPPLPTGYIDNLFIYGLTTQSNRTDGIDLFPSETYIDSNGGTTVVSAVVDANTASVSAAVSATESTPLQYHSATASGEVGDASLTYFFEVLSATQTTVDVNIQARGALEISGATAGSAGAEAEISLTGGAAHGSPYPLSLNDGLVVSDIPPYEGDPSIRQAGNVVVVGGWASGYDGFLSEDLTTTLATNTLYDINLMVEATAGEFAAYDATPQHEFNYTGGIVSGGTMNAFAYVDPYISLAPGTDPSQYTLLISQGVGNSPLTGAVPEAPSWLMMAVGFASLGLVGVHRRKTRWPTAQVNRPLVPIAD